MGLFFRKKRPSTGIPAPIRKFGDSEALKLPSKDGAERVITPKAKQFKKAAGVEGGFDKQLKDDMIPMPPSRPPRAAPLPSRPSPKLPDLGAPLPDMPERPLVSVKLNNQDGPVFVGMENYKMILNEIKDAKKELNDLAEISRNLEKSEFSEEKSFGDLRSSVKSLHDKLLSVDEVLFKQ